jgi:hypothetical protein
MTMRSGRAPILVVAILALLAATSCDISRKLFPCVERQHPSGITLVCAEDIEPWKDVSEDFKGAFSFARELAEFYPDAFGYPAADLARQEVTLRIVLPEGERLARSWIASGADLPMPKATRTIPRPTVPVHLEPASRSFAQLAQIQHDVGPNLAGLPDSNLVYQSGADLHRNATRFTIDHESDALLRALAARYGTEVLVVEIAPNTWH